MHAKQVLNVDDCRPILPLWQSNQANPCYAGDIYKAASKAKLIGTVEAAEADEAIEKAAKEYKVIASKFISVRYR